MNRPYASLHVQSGNDEDSEVAEENGRQADDEAVVKGGDDTGEGVRRETDVSLKIRVFSLGVVGVLRSVSFQTFISFSRCGNFQHCLTF